MAVDPVARWLASSLGGSVIAAGAGLRHDPGREHPGDSGAAVEQPRTVGTFGIDAALPSAPAGGDPVTDLVLRAFDVIGSPERLARWMQTPVKSLQGRTPYSLMDTEEGREQVELTLVRMEHGVY